MSTVDHERAWDNFYDALSETSNHADRTAALVRVLDKHGQLDQVKQAVLAHSRKDIVDV